MWSEEHGVGEASDSQPAGTRGGRESQEEQEEGPMGSAREAAAFFLLQVEYKEGQHSLVHGPSLKQQGSLETQQAAMAELRVSTVSMSGKIP